MEIQSDMQISRHKDKQTERRTYTKIERRDATKHPNYDLIWKDFMELLMKKNYKKKIRIRHFYFIKRNI